MNESTTSAPHRLRVAVPTPQHAGLAGCLDYAHPEPLAPGSLVRVPLGRRQVLGIVWDDDGQGDAPADLKPVAEVLALPADFVEEAKDRCRQTLEKGDGKPRFSAALLV